MPNVVLVRNDYPDLESLYRVINYVMKTPYYGGYGIDPEHSCTQMRLVKEAYHTLDGVQLKHFFITFSHEEMFHLDFDDILQLGFQTGKFFGEYQMIYCIHLDSDHVHLHFVMNTTSFLDGHKYSGGLTKFNGLCRWLKELYPRLSFQLFQTSRYSEQNPYTKEKKGQFQILN